MDNHQNVLDVNDELSGVYFMEKVNVHLHMPLELQFVFDWLKLTTLRGR